MARKVGAQPKNQLGYWVLPGDGKVQPFSERFQGYTRELSPSVLHCLLEPGNQLGKLNPLGGADFTDANMVKVAAYTGNPWDGDFQVYKEGAIAVSQHPEFNGADGLSASADCSLRGCKVAFRGIPDRRSSAASRVAWGRPSVGTGSVQALGMMEVKTGRFEPELLGKERISAARSKQVPHPFFAAVRAGSAICCALPVAAAL